MNSAITIFGLLIIFVIILFYCLSNLAQEKIDRKKETDSLQNGLNKSFVISDTCTHHIFSNEYETYWAKRAYEKIINFTTYAEPFFNKEKSETTIITEFQTALRNIQYSGDLTENLGNNPSEIFNLLKTDLVDSFVHSIIFDKKDKGGDKTISGQRLTASEEENVKKAIENCGQDIKPVDISKIFARALLVYVESFAVSSGRAGTNLPQGGDLINKFLEYWGKILFIPKHQEELASLALFMMGDFEKVDGADSVVLLEQKRLIVRLEKLYNSNTV